MNRYQHIRLLASHRVGTEDSQPKDSAAPLSLCDACCLAGQVPWDCSSTCAVGRFYVHLWEMEAEVSDQTVCGSVLCQGIRRSLSPCGNWLPLPPRLEYMGTWINRVDQCRSTCWETSTSFVHVCRKHLSYLVTVERYDFPLFFES